ncbi:putative drug resistance ABC transporter, ATP-binding protein [Clostridium pasteurianum DSM 525 = ATCC 6013]|uniref:ABC transporter related protein n=1 Tax=Clostridium pasteurianum DSM 525 = ATCC 6013 TaxID=1262449 RepID=A0A0H3J4U3_CLOPA|nr:ABC-F family ATP-binding cassette domain-containing protein [Clostridium pasteurianum]AJA48931.1 putative drug resistance ABC transporter, ATP-binding protein [Clostridium pasteurianum DSM 525 = ATCC 6013]AJA52919.1 putative drug resistance ABC transporter, ATP-binding protein [Clostridium pasteurianum DSM 525 = ATCC 6013]AOZ76140.1 thiamine ABC transporter substrate-binding protein [Clostridium pasteurianum DSM 525 = ATCC 6013]AOZ79936.1 thiamine ABC transporter substrate-binding protein [C
MIVLSTKNITKGYGIDIILEDVNFTINEGEKVGLIGANGAGKSTLFKILTNQLDQDSGELFIDKNKRVGYLSQHLSLDESNTVYDELLSVFKELLDIEKKLNNLESKMNEPYDIENEEYHNKIIKDYTTLTELYDTKGGYTYKGEINRVLNGLGFSSENYDKIINLLSGGQKTRVALCKLLLTKPDILLLDEPTNHLDLDAIEWLEQYLIAYKGTVILISHDRYFLDAITEKTLEMISGHVNVYSGNYTQALDLKKKNYEVQLKAYKLQQAEIKRQEEIIEKYRSFNREKSIKAAESRQKSLDKIERIKAPDKDGRASRINFETLIKSGNDVLHIENLSKSFGEKQLFKSLNLDIKRGEKTALIGENGRGKTTLFNILMDNIKSDTGIKVLGKNVFIGYYDQEQSDLNDEKTILDEVWDDFPNMTTTELRNALAAFLFTGDDVFKKIHNLSGGEKCRINLLKLMLSKSNFLLLDEPTNHLDIVSREALEEALLGYDGTILVISHDRYFLNKVVSKIYELEINGVKEYLGNYTYYIEKKRNPTRFEEEKTVFGKTKTQINLEKKKKREEEKSKKEEKLKLKNIEEEITDVESKISLLENKLCTEEVYSNPEKSEKINKELLDTKNKLEDLYNQWENYL